MDENVEFGQWISYVKIFLLILALSSAILYYVPVSRAYIRRGCLAIIDAIASVLIAALSIYEEENVVTSPVTALPSRVSRAVESPEYERSPRESKEHYRHEHLMRNRNLYKDTREINGDRSTMHFYPDRKCELDRDNIINLKWDERISRRTDNDILYAENDGPSQFYNNNQLLVSSVDDLENINENDAFENSKTRKHSNYNSQVFHHQVNDEQNVNENKDKVRNIRKKIQSIVSHSKKSSRENKKLDNVNDLPNDYLKKSSNQLVTKWSRKHDSKRHFKLSHPMESEKIYETVNVENSRLNRKSTVSTKKELPMKYKRNKVELPVSEIEDLATDSDYYLQPPIITDRVTPIVQSAYQWIFGGCPSSKHKRRK